MRKALILIDIQNDYFEKGRMTLVGAEQAAENAQAVLNAFRKERLPIVHIQHISTRPGATFFIPETEGVQIHKSVEPLSNEKVIIKNFPNSFKDTTLFDHLKSMDITDLVICGMMTHMCVDSTTRAAKDFGFNCVVIGDATATKDLEINGERVRANEVQKSFLAALNNIFSSITTAKQYLESAELTVS
jgi:nicotinamidase-related amidase